MTMTHKVWIVYLLSKLVVVLVVLNMQPHLYLLILFKYILSIFLDIISLIISCFNYDFESKSHPYQIWMNKKASCISYTEGTISKANHNKVFLHFCIKILVNIINFNNFVFSSRCPFCFRFF